MRNQKTPFALSMIAIVAIASGAFASRTLVNPPEAEITSKIAPFVLNAMNSNKDGGIPILVKLKAQADLSAIEKSGASRDVRLKEVYDALRTVALDSQGDLVTELEKNSVKYRRFYISNMIAV